jgi:hypothetical protein
MIGNSAREQRTSQEEDRRRPAGPARLVPRVTFGLGVAVLTGLAVVTVPPDPTATASEHSVTTTALGAAINEVVPSIPLTTCCGDKKPAGEINGNS